MRVLRISFNLNNDRTDEPAVETKIAEKMLLFLANLCSNSLHLKNYLREQPDKSRSVNLVNLVAYYILCDIMFRNFATLFGKAVEGEDNINLATQVFHTLFSFADGCEANRVILW